MAKTENIGIVLTNTGSPKSPSPEDIRPYLIEFLSDKNLVRVPHAIWLPILHGFISRTRPKKTAPRYERIWTPEGAPLLVHSMAQRDALNERFKQAGLPLVAEVGMRYVEPAMDGAVASLAAAGCSSWVEFPLFPQTAFCTVRTCKEKALKVAKAHPEIPLAHIIEGYGENPLYIKSLVASITEAWEYRPGSKILFSFHSVPLNDIQAGDTYLQEVEATLTLAMEAAGIPPEDWAVAYHSRFEDSRAWVAPHPKTVLGQWAGEGASRVAVATPGFAADCLESLYDINIVLREAFDHLCAQHGLQADFTYIPALNSREDHIDALFDVVVRALGMR